MDRLIFQIAYRTYDGMWTVWMRKLNSKWILAKVCESKKEANQFVYNRK